MSSVRGPKPEILRITASLTKLAISSLQATQSPASVFLSPAPRRAGTDASERCIAATCRTLHRPRVKFRERREVLVRLEVTALR
jgi:hypothetical protein